MLQKYDVMITSNYKEYITISLHLLDAAGSEWVYFVVIPLSRACIIKS